MGFQRGPKSVVGRDRLIESIWKHLESKSLRFNAERRIGKTTVMQKMRAEPQEGCHVLFIDLEKVESAQRFTESLLDELRALFNTRSRVLLGLSELRDWISGLEVRGVVKIPDGRHRDWKEILLKAFELLYGQDPELRIVLLLDELPYMLQKIAQQDRLASVNANTPLEILDTLRALRQEFPNLRMILAGSIGLHHVLTEVRQPKLASQPLNDLYAIEIGPLAPDDAKSLAIQLLQTEKVQVDAVEMAPLAEALVQATDGIPFYLERAIARLSEREGDITAAVALTLVESMLADDRNDWEMEHFRTRLGDYYEGAVTDVAGRSIPRNRIARSILDLLAVASQPQSIDQVWLLLKSQFQFDDRDAIVSLLSSLSQDHYLKTDSQKNYTFRFPLIRRWWVLAQGLRS